MDWPDLMHGMQSALAPAGPRGGTIADLTWLMFICGGLIFVGVMALVVLAITAPQRWRHWLGHRQTIIAGGIAFPVVTLTGLLSFGLVQGSGLPPQGEPGLRIEVVGEMWWWRVHYLDAGGRIDLATANEIHVPLDVPVEFVLRSNDVIHAFWIPSLGIKLDMIPGRVNRTRTVATKPGLYRGQCAEYCGEQHARMAFHVVAMERAEFDEWYAAQTRPVAEPLVSDRQLGAELFISNGCGACHTVRGTEANGTIGPDLTHVGARRFIAAGLLPNNRGTLAGWIASAQHLKPGNRMPSFDNLAGRELRAVAAYLEGLK